MKKKKLCACGCGNKINWKPHHKYNNVRFINGHNMNGIKRPKISKMMKGEGNHQYGKKHSKEHKKKISIGVRKAFNEKGGHPLFIDKESVKYKKWLKNNSESHKEYFKNNDAPMKNKKLSDERKKFLSEYFSGENHPCWKGGISKEPYDFAFNDSLKLIVKRRDMFRCVVCGVKPKGQLNVHHIDYNKKNSIEKNLCCLCQLCHGKTIWGDRNMWTSALIGLMVERYSYSY